MDEIIEIYGLAYGCPRKKRVNGCPFRKLDELSFGERVDYLENLSDKEKKAFLSEHRNCNCKYKLDKNDKGMEYH